jgi:hypothetical protein
MSGIDVRPFRSNHSLFDTYRQIWPRSKRRSNARKTICRFECMDLRAWMFGDIARERLLDMGRRLAPARRNAMIGSPSAYLFARRGLARGPFSLCSWRPACSRLPIQPTPSTRSSACGSDRRSSSPRPLLRATAQRSQPSDGSSSRS